MKPTSTHAASTKAALNIVLLAIGLCAATASQAQTYQFIDLGPGTAAGINDLGQVVGQSPLGATLWNGSGAIGLVGGLGGSASGINDLGQIVGSTVSNGISNAALWSSGKLTTLNDPGNNLNSYAIAINNAGQIVGGGNHGSVLFWDRSINATELSSSVGGGYQGLGIGSNGTVLGSVYNSASNSIVATTWLGANATTLPGLVDYYGRAQANAINDAGVVVGSSATEPQSGTDVPLVWKGGSVTQLGSLGGGNGYASAINNAGQIVGTSTTANNYDYATIWKGTTAINLDSYLTPAEIAAGWMLTSATGINDKGWIIGDAYNNNTGAQDAFLLEVSPVPEAGTWAMFATGIAMMAALALFKRARNARQAGQYGKPMLQGALLAAGICAAGTSQAQGTGYQFIDLGNGNATGINALGQVVGYSGIGATLWNGSTITALAGGATGYPYAINNAGKIVGASALFDSGSAGPTVWAGKTASALPTQEGFGTAYAVNSAGQVVGNGGEYAALWNNGVRTNLSVTVNEDPWGGTATGINNAGKIAGYVQDFGGNMYAVSWTTAGGQGSFLNTLGGNFSQATAINSAGEIVGQSTNAAGTLYATEWNGTAATELQSLGGQRSYAYGIDNAGVVVGSSTDVNGQVFATEWNGTSVVNLNNYLTPAEKQAGWVLTEATAINQNGWIVGDAVNTKVGGSEAFELKVVSSVPEADGWVMLLVGLVLIGLLARFKPRLAPFAKIIRGNRASRSRPECPRY